MDLGLTSSNSSLPDRWWAGPELETAREAPATDSGALSGGGAEHLWQLSISLNEGTRGSRSPGFTCMQQPCVFTCEENCGSRISCSCTYTPDTCTQPGGIPFPLCPAGWGQGCYGDNDNDFGHLTHSLKVDNVADDLPHSRLVLDDNNLASEDNKMQEDLLHSSAIARVSPAKKINKNHPPRQRRQSPNKTARKKAVTDNHALQ